MTETGARMYCPVTLFHSNAFWCAASETPATGGAKSEKSRLELIVAIALRNVDADAIENGCRKAYQCFEFDLGQECHQGNVANAAW